MMKKLLATLLMLLPLATFAAPGDPGAPAVLTWDEGDTTNHPPSVEYHIYRQDAACGSDKNIWPFYQVGSTDAPVKTYSDEGLIEGDSYCWRLTASLIDQTYESDKSNMVGRVIDPMPVAGSPPGAPLNLQVQ